MQSGVESLDLAKQRIGVLSLEAKQHEGLVARGAGDQHELFVGVAQRVDGHAGEPLLDGLRRHPGGPPRRAEGPRAAGRRYSSPVGGSVGPATGRRVEGEGLPGVGLEVGESGLEVGFEGRRVLGGDLGEERREVVVESGEGLVEVELGLFGRWESCGVVLGFVQVHLCVSQSQAERVGTQRFWV